MDKELLRFRVTYADGSDGGIITPEAFRMIQIKKGERPAWIEQFIDLIIKDGYAVTKFGTTYQLIISNK